MTVMEMQSAREFAAELRRDVIAIELITQRVAGRRAMSQQHRDEVADHFGAKRKAVSGSKQLYAPNQKEIKKISGVLFKTIEAWRNATIGYRKGIRLLRCEQLEKWNEKSEGLQRELNAALAEADANYNAIIDAARESLGPELFDRTDYPATFAGSVTIQWGVYNFEPSEDLLQLAPETYQREQERVRKQFEAAVTVFEQESREQLQGLVGALLGKLTAAEDGKKVVYTEAAATNLREFFDRFDSLNIRSDETLTDLVSAAKDALGGTTMADLKKDVLKRRELSQAFEDVADKLGSLIMEAPARSINIDDLD